LDRRIDDIMNKVAAEKQDGEKKNTNEGKNMVCGILTLHKKMNSFPYLFKYNS